MQDIAPSPGRQWGRPLAVNLHLRQALKYPHLYTQGSAALPRPRKAPHLPALTLKKCYIEPCVLGTGIKELKQGKQLRVICAPSLTNRIKNSDLKKSFIIQGVFYLGNSEHLRITLRWHITNILPENFLQKWLQWRLEGTHWHVDQEWYLKLTGNCHLEPKE